MGERCIEVTIGSDKSFVGMLDHATINSACLITFMSQSVAPFLFNKCTMPRHQSVTKIIYNIMRSDEVLHRSKLNSWNNVAS